MYTEKLSTHDGMSTRTSFVRPTSEKLVGPTGHVVAEIIRTDGSREVIEGHNARVSIGFATTAALIFNGTAANPFNYMALSSTAITPANGDTTLTGEISTNGGARATVGTVVLTNPSSIGGTGTAVASKTFTATGALTVNAIALFNAATAGTMFSEIALGSTATLASGDSLAITYTITM